MLTIFQLLWRRAKSAYLQHKQNKLIKEILNGKNLK